MVWFVYILKSLKDNSYYIGCSSDVSRRLLVHNKGYNESTKKHAPFKLIYQETYLDRTEAFLREKKIKSYKGGEAFKKLIK